VIDADPPCLKQMLDVFDERGGSVLATMTIDGPGISAYGVLAGSQDPDNERIYNCTGMVEKPKLADAPSKQAIIGRYVLTPRVFELLEETTPGAGGEIQLTDGIKALLKEEKVFGYTFEGKRYDAGDKFGMLQATVEFALKRSDLGPQFREYLKGLAL
jgi:UTP--glucose-1-phosphate uridylyltransferase